MFTLTVKTLDGNFSTTLSANIDIFGKHYQEIQNIASKSECNIESKNIFVFYDSKNMFFFLSKLSSILACG